MGFRLIVGLGNPGAAYEKTRHNIGFRVVEQFAQAKGAEEWQKNRKLKGEAAQLEQKGSEKLYLVKPMTFMNESGVCLQKVSSYYKIPPEEVIVVYDEINLDVGEVKISVRGGPGGHNGLSDIIDRMKPNFTRVRIGIGQKTPKEIDLADYVLGKFSEEDETVIGASMERYIDCLDRLLKEGSEKAMNFVNRKPKPKQREDGQL
ncbi:MAG TPA: aminoacyl-tRNA hydrolase [Opitutae bacterium]|nr:aminoacyl-tRNA hydrolase [Opitutaceae bacterium]HCR28493.1 aminoacyl-tRNA hydrolase [Opitutae bacterium]